MVADTTRSSALSGMVNCTTLVFMPTVKNRNDKAERTSSGFIQGIWYLGPGCVRTWHLERSSNVRHTRAWMESLERPSHRTPPTGRFRLTPKTIRYVGNVSTKCKLVNCHGGSETALHNDVIVTNILTNVRRAFGVQGRFSNRINKLNN